MRSINLARFLGVQLLAALTLALLVVGVTPAHAAVVWTKVGGGACVTSATSCSVNLTSSVSSGSFVVAVAVINTSSALTFTAADSASNCSGSYTGLGALSKVLVNASVNGSILAAYCPSTTTGMTTSNTVTFTSPSTTYAFTISVYTVTGVSAYDKLGAAVQGTWTSGSATSFATSPVLGYTSESALGLIVSGNGATADTMGTYTGGYTSFDTQTGASSKPEIFAATQALTSGTAVLGATPTSAAGRSYNSVVFNFIATGALPLCGHQLTLVGAGC